MDSKYELTIIISNYNQEKHISETVDSVFAQVVNFPFKVIITDDYSSADNSRELIRKYADRYTNVEPIFAGENGGYLMNILRAKARTDTKYFCLLDVDDYWTDKGFLQRAYDFLEAHPEYTIYEANVEVVSENGNPSPEGDSTLLEPGKTISGAETTYFYAEKKGHPFIQSKFKSGTYSKAVLLDNQPVPITQTTGMFLRNCIFINGIPDIMRDAVGTRSERSFEGDTGRFIMHLKHGLAYYDDRIVGVYRLTDNGIWNSLSDAKKQIITARMQLDYFSYYGPNSDFFVNRAYKALQRYLEIKQKELTELQEMSDFIDEEERLMADDVYSFCRQHEDVIKRDKRSLLDKAKRVYKAIKE